MLLLAWSIRDPETLTTLSGQSEQIVFFPVDDGQLELESVRLIQIGGGKPLDTCLTKVAIKSQGGGIKFERDSREPGSVSIVADGKVGISAAEFEKGRVLSGPVYFELSSAGDACNARDVTRIPLRGGIQIGREGDDNVSHFTKGKLTIFGRTGDSLLAWFFTSNRNDGASIVYPAGEMDLPFGSRVASWNLGNQRVSSEQGWSGFVEVNLDNPDEGLGFWFLTNSADIYIWPSIARSQDPEKISLTLSARLAGDPFLQWLLGVLGASLILIGIMAQRWPVGK